MTGRLFVVAAFVLTWAAVAGYYIHLHRLARRSRELLDHAMATTATGKGVR